jgi:hypothetical protein
MKLAPPQKRLEGVSSILDGNDRTSAHCIKQVGYRSDPALEQVYIGIWSTKSVEPWHTAYSRKLDLAYGISW